MYMFALVIVFNVKMGMYKKIKIPFITKKTKIENKSKYY